MFEIFYYIASTSWGAGGRVVCGMYKVEILTQESLGVCGVCVCVGDMWHYLGNIVGESARRSCPRLVLLLTPCVDTSNRVSLNKMDGISSSPTTPLFVSQQRPRTSSRNTN